MSLEVLLAEGARFAVLWRDRDMALLPHPEPSADGTSFATDLSGGRYVLIETSQDEASGVWWLGSEGQRARLAPTVLALFARVSEGFTIDDLAAGRASPSQRASAGEIGRAHV